MVKTMLFFSVHFFLKDTVTIVAGTWQFLKQKNMEVEGCPAFLAPKPNEA